MKIGNLELNNNVFLAPMAGITDKPFRELCREFGAGLVYSEMVSAKGLYYKDKKTASLMDIAGESPAAIQIFGSDADIMAEVIPQVMEFKPDIIDINMGCPAPKIVNNGDGSALMKNPPLMGEIARKVVDASPVPVTVKMRMGWDSDNVLESAKIVEAAGVSAICIHGRTRKQFYSGEADWDAIKRVKEGVGIPVIGNGDIWFAEDVVAMLDYTGCDAVMIARGAQGNPWIFKQAQELLCEGEIKTMPTPKERLRVCIRHVERLCDDKGEGRGIKEARKHIAWYIKGLKGASQIKTEIFKISDFATMHSVLEDYIEKNL